MKRRKSKHSAALPFLLLILQLSLYFSYALGRHGLHCTKFNYLQYPYLRTPEKQSPVLLF